MPIFQPPVKQARRDAINTHLDIHLVYDEELTLNESVYRYRLWFGVNRMTVCLISPVKGEPPSLNADKIATKLYNAHIARAKRDRNTPFIYLELHTDSTGQKSINKYEFDRVNDGDTVRFWNTRVKPMELRVLNSLVGGPIDG